ncbi:MAG: NAD-dependent epimerase/dehydratase family protein, partial [Gemmatimonadales bacterium]
MTAPRTGPPRVLVTGASGYIGSLLVAELSRALAAGRIGALVATDIRPSASSVFGLPSPVALFVQHDIRDNGLAVLLRRHAVDCVIHLASIVTPSKGSTREFEYSVDVGGTRRVLDACIQAGVRRIVVTSSGAAYGYHADNPEWITENAP